VSAQTIGRSRDAQDPKGSSVRGIGGPDEWIHLAEEVARQLGCYFTDKTYATLAAAAVSAEEAIRLEPGRREEAKRDLRIFIERMADAAKSEDTSAISPQHFQGAKKKCGCFPWCYLRSMEQEG